jgi:TRAP-type uncharacterized transport system fused permease subunit
MMQAWKYTLPAFVVPVIFCLPPLGPGLLFEGSLADIATITLTAAAALFALSLAAAGWLRGPVGPIGRLVALLAGVGLIIPDIRWQLAGAAAILAVIAAEMLRRDRVAGSPGTD